MTSKHIAQLCCIFGATLLPQIAMSQHLSLNYESRVDLVLLDESAPIACNFDEYPAEVSFDEDTRATVRAAFPDALLNLPKPKTITVRRGADLKTERLDETPGGFRAPETNESATTAATPDWAMVVTGRAYLCVGLASLRVVKQDFDVVVRVGPYEAQLETDALFANYAVHTSDTFAPIVLDPTETFLDIGSVPQGDGRRVGNLTFGGRRLPVSFNHDDGLPTESWPANFHVTLFLYVPSNDAP